MLINPRNIQYARILAAYHRSNDYLIVVRFDTPKNENAYEYFHNWLLEHLQGGVYSTMPSQGFAGVFIGTVEELKKEIEKELK